MDLFDDAFGSTDSTPASGPAEADPAAEFMQREQADLGGLGMDFGMTPAPASVPTLALEGDGTNSFFESSNNESSNMTNGLEDMPTSGMPDFSSSATLDSSSMPPSSGFGAPDIGGMSTTAMPDFTSNDASNSGMPNFSSSASLDSSTMPTLNSSTMPDNSGFGMPDIGNMSTMPDIGSMITMPDIGNMSTMPDIGSMSTMPDIGSMSTMPDIGSMSTTASADMPDFATNGATEVSNSGMPDFSSEKMGSGLPSVSAVDPMEEGGPFETSRVDQRQSGEEPECIRKWREEQKERIRIKDEEEAKKKEELRQKAKMELESWYKSYEDELQQTKKENRVAEEAFLADVNGLKPGTEWERVSRNCNFNSKVNHNKKDRSRLRNVLLQLKQTPLMNRE